MLLTATSKVIPSAGSPTILLKTEDPESLLAMGDKIEFAKAGEFELQLIPNVGDTLSKSLLAARWRILQNAAQVPCNQIHKSLVAAHGVGEKTALKLITYLNLGEKERCK